MRTLTGKLAVITGAASGIGRALAEQLAREGCYLALVDIDASGLEETASRLVGKVSIHAVDTSLRSAPCRQ
jgi:NAD(P)-dependent dehydrogenase (short-subunit alcohol dehydrogenase family)